MVSACRRSHADGCVQVFWVDAGNTTHICTGDDFKAMMAASTAPSGVQVSRVLHCATRTDMGALSPMSMTAFDAIKLIDACALPQ